MNFLDPEEWKDLRELEKEHEVLTEELVKELHTRLRPYFLRRIKSEVLKLPPKVSSIYQFHILLLNLAQNEVIVPVSMTPLQKEVYRSILSQNLDILKSLTQPADAKAARAIKRTNLNNMLMQLRKYAISYHPELFVDECQVPSTSLSRFRRNRTERISSR
jgi:chromodomain-helicase-DNA-binding protein 4